MLERWAIEFLIPYIPFVKDHELLIDYTLIIIFLIGASLFLLYSIFGD